MPYLDSLTVIVGISIGALLLLDALLLLAVVRQYRRRRAARMESRF